MFSIRDKLNSFGIVTGNGELPDKIYVGRTQSDGKPGYGYPRPPEGGEASIPYFVEFCVTGETAVPTTAVTLSIYGAKENDSLTAPSSGWVVIGTLTIPAGEWSLTTRPRVAVSDNTYKWFKCAVAGSSGTAKIRADFMRYSY
jgi:hypothetical protein